MAKDLGSSTASDSDSDDIFEPRKNRKKSTATKKVRMNPIKVFTPGACSVSHGKDNIDGSPSDVVSLKNTSSSATVSSSPSLSVNIQSSQKVHLSSKINKLSTQAVTLSSQSHTSTAQPNGKVKPKFFSFKPSNVSLGNKKVSK